MTELLLGLLSHAHYCNHVCHVMMRTSQKKVY